MPAQSTYTPIQTITVSGSSTTSVSFNSVPSTYTDLVVIAQTYNTSNSFLQYLEIGSSGGNYSGTILRSDGASGLSSRYGNDNVMLGDSPVGMNYQNSAYAVYVYNIFNYANTNTFKSAICQFAGDRNGAGNVILGAFLKRSTAAVTQVLLSVGGGAFANGSTFTLYGITAA